MERKDSKHSLAAEVPPALRPGREFVHALALSQAAVVSSRQKLSATSRADAVRRFIAWSLARLRESSADFADVEHGNDGELGIWLELPRSQREKFGGSTRVRLRLDALNEIVPADDEMPGDLSRPQQAVLPWLIQQLGEAQVITHAVPWAQPASVHEIAKDLFAAYQVDGGTMHLAGCTLEDRVILGLTYRYRVNKTQPNERDVAVFIAPDGALIDDATVAALGLHDRRVITQPPRIHPEELIRLVEVIRQNGDRVRDRELARDGHVAGDGTDLRRVSCELRSGVFIWCKYAEGKIQFDFGDESTSVPFSGWARVVRPQPFHCPYTGVASYHIAQTDDGRIVAADEIETCQLSGRRVLRDELVECAVSGLRVAAELAEACPVTELHVLPEHMVECPMCRQRVAPASLEQGQCATCRSRQRADRDDERLVRILGHYPMLVDWGDVRLSESLTTYNLTISRRLQRLMLVLDKATLAPLHAASARRWSNTWSPLTVDELTDALS
ncbi:MAG: hypothetical protein KDA63_08930 [Planctomycetales bacterium]|nr:hypothetical protein [Planctomycetales bacterium]